jgi:hypothetical protein
VKDWVLLTEAVDQQMADQRRLVNWWGENIRSQGEARKENPDRGFLSVAQAVRTIGISQQKVSRWRLKLEDEDAYRCIPEGRQICRPSFPSPTRLRN